MAQESGNKTLNTSGGSVPIVIGYRKVSKRPVYKRIRSFVGFRRLVLNFAIKAIDFVEDVCFESENAVVDPGEQEVVYWAIEVDEPWGVNNISDIQARKMPDKPGCGVYTEVIRVVDKKAEQQEARRQAEEHTPQPPQLPPEVMHAVNRHRPKQTDIRERLRKRLVQDGHYDPEAGPAPTDNGT